MSSLYAEAALANLDEAIETMTAASRARSDQGMWTLLARAQFQARNAREKLAYAIAPAEMSVTAGEETGE